MNVKLVTTNSFGWNSIGDFAIEQTTIQSLAKRGIAVLTTHELNDKDIGIIGGGHIIGTDGSLPNSMRIKGPHILSGAEIRHGISDENLEYLKDYKYVSVRTVASQRILNKLKIEAKLVPDPVMSMDIANVLPDHLPSNLRFEKISDAMCNHRLQNKLFFAGFKMIEFQPWQNSDRVKHLDLMYNVFVLAQVISQCKLVVAHSLHLALLALVCKVPFSVITFADNGQDIKLKDYFIPRGLECLLGGLDNAEKRAMDNHDKIVEVSKREKIEIENHFDAIANIVKSSTLVE